MPGGRPTDEPKQTLVAVRLAARQMRVLKSRARREGIGMSEALRRCLDEWISLNSTTRAPEPKPRPLTNEERETFDQLFAAFGYRPRRSKRRRR